MNKSPIFYFTGTGNSLAIARAMADALGDFEPVPIAALADGGPVTVGAAAGFVFPLNYAGLPRIVKRFAEQLRFAGPCYVFAVVTCANPRASRALRQLRRCLRRRGATLSAGYTLPMTTNYLPHNELNSPERQERDNARGWARLPSIIEGIRSRGEHLDREGTVWLGALHFAFIRQARRLDRFFRAEANCTSCGQCERLCPVNNVTLEHGRPVWHGDCEFCLACIHWCPQRAIQWKEVTATRGRYRCSGITAADVAAQKRLPKAGEEPSG